MSYLNDAPLDNIFLLLQAITRGLKPREREAWFANNLPKTYGHVMINRALRNMKPQT
jgi:hypothetical protein